MISLAIPSGRNVYMKDNGQMIITNLFRGDKQTSKPEITSGEMKKIIQSVCDSLHENGFDPVRQIVGYIISEDPAYIPDYDNARTLLSKIDRDTLLTEIVSSYIGIEARPENDND